MQGLFRRGGVWHPRLGCSFKAANSGWQTKCQIAISPVKRPLPSLANLRDL